MADEPCVSVRALAKRWGVCRNTVLRLVWAGKLKALRIGEQIRFRIATIKAYEEELESAPPEKFRARGGGRKRAI